MVGYSLFQTSTLGMRSQSHALSNIGNNVANINTGGFKRTDTRFETVLSETLDSKVTDNGGVKPKDFHIIDGQGFLSSTGRELDIAIVGNGFFEVSKDFTGTGGSFYTRDGSFRVSSADAFSVSKDGLSTPGYLIDKNGYYVQGWAANIDGSFTDGGAPAPMRVDPESYATQFIATNLATLQLNLPSDDTLISDHSNAVLSTRGGKEIDGYRSFASQIVDETGSKQTATLNFTRSGTNQWEVSATTPRVSSPQAGTIVINGSVEAGDIYNVTIDGNTISYTTTGAEGSSKGIRDAIITTINGNANASSKLKATEGLTDREITLTANSSINTQVDTVTLSGSVEAGDQYSVTVDGNTATYTVLGTESGINDIRTGLVAAITANTSISAIVTAAAGLPSGDITLTSIAAGTSFTSSSSASVVGGTADNRAITSNTILNGPTTFSAIGSVTNKANTAQVETVTIAGTPEANDQYSVSINGNVVNYSVAPADTTLTAIRNKLITAINTDIDTGGIVTAAAGGSAGEITLTAKTAGKAFTSVVATPTTGATTDNSAISATTTANFLTKNDNTLTVVPNLAFETTPSQVLSFNSNGTNTNADPLSFALKFADGATSSFKLDVSEMTQFGRSFSPMRYSQNGLASGRMNNIEFDKLGHVIGSFDDGTKRKLFKIPLTKFSNPNGLAIKNGLFLETAGIEGSGAGIRFALDKSGIASLTPGAIELSNVDMTVEFSQMIAVQNSYNSNATVFKTVDEMTMTARDLKA